jgi:hypothetical protein
MTNNPVGLVMHFHMYIYMKATLVLNDLVSSASLYPFTPSIHLQPRLALTWTRCNSFLRELNDKVLRIRYENSTLHFCI